MRISTSIYAIEAALGQECFSKILEAYSKNVDHQTDVANLGWHWILTELDSPLPKSAYGLKSDPVQHLAIGLSRGHYALCLSIKPETGRVWLSPTFPGSIAPVEVALAMRKRAMPNVGSKWTGLMVDIFMPMHQKHPGLAEHAIVGGVQDVHSNIFCFISDRPDPMLAPLWHIYRFHPARRVAQALLSVVDRVGQKDFRSTLVGQDLTLRDYSGKKLDDDQLLASLAGVRKFVWRTDQGTETSNIPLNARKFKLGEDLGAHECKSMPAKAFIGALDSFLKKG